MFPFDIKGFHATRCDPHICMLVYGEHAVEFRKFIRSHELHEIEEMDLDGKNYSWNEHMLVTIETDDRRDLERLNLFDRDTSSSLEDLFYLDNRFAEEKIIRFACSEVRDKCVVETNEAIYFPAATRIAKGIAFRGQVLISPTGETIAYQEELYNIYWINKSNPGESECNFRVCG